MNLAAPDLIRSSEPNISTISSFPKAIGMLGKAFSRAVRHTIPFVFAGTIALQGCGANPKKDPFPGISADAKNACTVAGFTTKPALHIKGNRAHAVFQDVNKQSDFPEIYGSAVSVGDLNSDGRPDVLAMGEGADATVAINCADENGNMHFVPFNLNDRIVEGDSVPDVPVASNIVDYNDDGKPDIVVSDERDTYILWQKEGLKFSSALLFRRSLEKGGSYITTTNPVRLRNDPTGAPDLIVTLKSQVGIADVPVPEAEDAFFINKDGKGNLVMSNGDPQLATPVADSRVDKWAYLKMLSGIPNQKPILVMQRDGGVAVARTIDRSGPPNEIATFGPDLLLGHPNIHISTSMGGDSSIRKDGSSVGIFPETLEVDSIERDAVDGSLKKANVVIQPAVAQNYWSTQIDDFNNDGKPDLVVGTGVGGRNAAERTELAQKDFSGSSENTHLHFFEGTSDGKFTDASSTSGPYFTKTPNDTYRIVSTDLDGDGYPDIVVAPFAFGDPRDPATPTVSDRYHGPVTILRNEGHTPGNYATVKINPSIRGSQDAVIMIRTAIGNVLYGTNKLTSGLGGSPRDVHFGLGDEEIATMEVRWDDGQTTTLPGNIPTNQTISIDQR